METTKQILHLSEVIDIDMLQEIIDSFTEATGLATLITTYQGKPITHLCSNFNPFCDKVRQDPNGGGDGCEKSDAYGGLESVRRGSPYVYRCHMGIVDVSVPIIVNGQYLGVILLGQVLVEKENMEKLDWVTKGKMDIENDPELKQLYNTFTTIPLHKLEAYSRLLFIIANYITEKGLTNIVQQQLNKQNIQLLEETKAKIELEKALNEAELKTLQAQVNPHFLFNTLNTISRQALVEGATKTQEIVFALAELLRESLYRVGQMASLEDEIACVKNYLLIKKTYMRDRLKIETNIDETCLDMEFPLFILQPLVENALIHGLEPKEEGGLLIITAAKDQSMVHLEIIDDGLGMPAEMAGEMNLKHNVSGQNNLTGLGIHNVLNRLHYHFGTEFKWNIKSNLGKGTKFTLIIPYRPNKGGF